MSADIRVLRWPKRLKEIGQPDDGASRKARARLKRDIGNGIGVAPAGTLGHLTTSGTGWHLLRFTADPCPCCGIRWRCGRLGTDDLELVEVIGAGPA